MQIQSISSNLNNNNNNNISFKNGLYFAKTPYILFNKKTPINYFANEKFKYNIFNSEILTSKEGFRYIKDDITPADIKKEVTNLPFIKDLAERFDTFVVCHKPSFIDNLKKYSSILEVFWADYSKGQVQNEVVIGYSKKSETDAVKNMIHNLSIKEFSSFKF